MLALILISLVLESVMGKNPLLWEILVKCDCRLPEFTFLRFPQVLKSGKGG